MVTTLSHFLLTQALWSITAGLNQLFLTMFFLFILLKLWDHLTILRALAFSVGLTCTAFSIFFGLVALILIWGFDLPYVQPATAYEDSFSILSSALWLAAIYVSLQLLMIVILNKIISVRMGRVFACIIIANVLSALIVYKIVPAI